MIKFYRSYQSVKKYGTQETQGIEDGKSYVFPKIDGTNASVWFDGVDIQAGSRRRILDETSDGDNAGFCKFARKNNNLLEFFKKHPDLRLYGEWLVPHSLKTYREDAWRKFYVFDVVRELEPDVEGGEFVYLSYDDYKPLLDEFGLDYINPIGIVKNASLDNYIHYLSANGFLIKDGEGNGEGIVIKNYDFVNKYGRIVWAKIVTNEFKEKHYRTMGAPEVQTAVLEEKIVNKYVSEALIEKEYSKILHENGGEWHSKFIPRLLNTVYYCLVTEELWSALKEFKNPSINFRALLNFCNAKVKRVRSDLF